MVNPRWEYARVRVANIGEEGDDVVIIINETIQDFLNSPRYPLEVLNAMGSEGWELVTVFYVIPPSPDAILSRYLRDYVLKRQLIE